jgi:hypothetical protein
MRTRAAVVVLDKGVIKHQERDRLIQEHHVLFLEEEAHCF